MLRAVDVAVGHGKNTLLSQITLFLEAKIYFLLGENGVGKTTLLRTLAGLTRTQSGSVAFKNKMLTTSSSKNERPAFLAAEPHANRELYAEEVLQFYSPDSQRFLLNELLKSFQLHSLLSRKLYQLSSGERRRLFLCATLALDSDFVILDEPFNFLDYSFSFVLFNEIQKQQKQGRGFLITSHDLSWPIRMTGSDSLLIHQGHIIKSGGTTEVLKSHELQQALNIHTEILTNPSDSGPLLAISTSRISK